MAGRVHDIDFCIAVMHRRVFGKDRNAPFALQGIAVHNSLVNHLICAECAALAQHFVHQRGLAVVNMRNNGYISQIVYLHFAAPLSESSRLSCRQLSRGAVNNPLVFYHYAPRLASAKTVILIPYCA